MGGLEEIESSVHKASCDTMVVSESYHALCLLLPN